VIVFKIGGSLLTLPRLAELVRKLIADHRPGEVLFVVGGGDAADAVRTWDEVHQLGERTSHALALKSLDLTRELLRQLVPELRPVRSRSQLAQAEREGVPAVLCVDCFLKSTLRGEAGGIEQSWRVTSDSIAAWVAGMLPSSKLVLLKSVPVPQGMSLAAAAEAGLVDEAFPQMAAPLPTIGWLNGRAGEWVLEDWTPAERVLPNLSKS
jgi:5-(aminomethyl)-3-furanmethanol phosphate kinase